MTSHSETKFLPYGAKEMFALVADVSSYPEFLPWCAAARIRKEVQKGEVKQIEADLIISFKVFREKFGSRVLLDPVKYIIETDYIDGPFRYMHSVWSFRDCEEGCEVNFIVDFEFKNAVLQSIIGLVFNDAMQRIVRAFERRASELYT
ncbi:MAG: ubiquinone-binding protein [Rhodobacteraceae bacterium TMED111]|nr:ubiquinone-binding protein [Marinovum sp.]OUV42466.1 MAG: ubiquinone-binding protein [Rhodobacteraceae bacterium TMED111]